jgi:hypothetical protein
MFRFTSHTAAAGAPPRLHLSTRSSAKGAHGALPETPGTAVLESALRSWIDSDTKPEVLDIGTRDSVGMPMEPALRRLTASTEPLSPACGESLGLEASATIGAAATALLRARVDPTGPRCRSYRAAAYYLTGRALLDLDVFSPHASVDP